MPSIAQYAYRRRAYAVIIRVEQFAQQGLVHTIETPSYPQAFKKVVFTSQ